MSGARNCKDPGRDPDGSRWEARMRRFSGGWFVACAARPKSPRNKLGGWPSPDMHVFAAETSFDWSKRWHLGLLQHSNPTPKETTHLANRGSPFHGLDTGFSAGKLRGCLGESQKIGEGDGRVPLRSP